MPTPLRRSLLYVPAASEKMLSRAGERGADTLVLDLEDGVHPDAKGAARERLVAALREPRFGEAEVVVRVNHETTPWGRADLEALAARPPDAVLLPKTARPEEIERAERALGGAVPLMLMIETAAGVQAAGELAAATPRVTALVFGSADFRASMRAGRLEDELELLHARSRLLVAARAAGVDAIDAPWFDLGDGDGLERSARRAQGLGFDGKCAIHPGQLGVLHRVFSPGPEEVVRARRVVEALARAAAAGRGVAVLDGEMIEPLHAGEARRTLERARRLGLATET